MRQMLKWSMWLLAGYVAFFTGSAPAQPILIVHSFTGGANDGQAPTGALLLSGSTLYGMTPDGGSGGDGTIFQVGSDGTAFRVMRSFNAGPNDGSSPYGSLTVSGQNFFGTTWSGGSANGGAVFRIQNDGTNFSVLYPFSGPDGSRPFGSLVQSGTTFYGTTNSGGSANQGTVFKINTDGTGFAILHNFGTAANDGQLPGYGSLAISGSTVYGMTSSGGSASVGTVYKVNTDGTGYVTLHSFTGGPNDGFGPQSSVILVGSTLYGTTFRGGAADGGVLFQINTDGTGFKIVHSFAGGPFDGANPVAGLLQVGSMLYGTTGRGGADALGTLFGIDVDGTDYQVLHSFAGGPGDGNGPGGDLILVGSDLYGMTEAGGSSNLGTIYSFPVPEPSSLLLIAAAGSLALVFRRRRPLPH